MDLVKQAGSLKPRLVEFALSPRFDHELSALIERNFPGGFVADEPLLSMTLDYFMLQHRLPSGTTVVEEFVTAHPELSAAEQDLLLGWRDVVEGVFEVAGKDGDTVMLVNLLDELTYRTRSNMGCQAFRTLKKQMIVICRLVRIGDDWLVSGNLATFPVSARQDMLVAAAEQAMRSPEAVFRNPAKLADARSALTHQHQVFTRLFGCDLVVVPAAEVPPKVEEFHRCLANQAAPDHPPKPVTLDLPR
ncbi:MAG TPA: hypothetical protein VGS19_12850 [Streptosporangiaceae bacterium]|nr:hypothetical protein [Streptosporangiaceae bacterium]